jgi:hypothetical protein
VESSVLVTKIVTMSRSRKKEPWVKDPANTYMKKIHARKMRRCVNQIMHVFKYHYREGDDPVIPHYRSVTNQYDICDYKMYCENNDKYLRK